MKYDYFSAVSSDIEKVKKEFPHFTKDVIFRSDDVTGWSDSYTRLTDSEKEKAVLENKTLLKECKKYFDDYTSFEDISHWDSNIRCYVFLAINNLL